MRKIILAAVCATAIGALSVGPASAQATGPAGQDATKMGTDTGTSKDGMAKSGTSGTQGMSKESSQKAHAKKDKMMMKNDEMKK